METTSGSDSGSPIDSEATREGLRAVRRGQWNAFRSSPKAPPLWQRAGLAGGAAVYFVVTIEGGELASQVVMAVYLVTMGLYVWWSRRKRRDAPQRWRGLPPQLRRPLIRIQLSYIVAGLVLGVLPIAEHHLMTPSLLRTTLEAVTVAALVLGAAWLCDRAATRTYHRWLDGQPT